MADTFKPLLPFRVGEAMSQPFRLPGGRSFLIRLLLWTVAILLLAYFFFGRQLISAYADMILTMMSFEGTELEQDPTAMMEAMAPMMKASGAATLLMIVSWLVMISSETAFHKNLLRGTDHGLFPLRFGADEFRVLVAQIIVGIILYVGFFVVYIAMFIFIGIGIGVGAAGGAAGAVIGAVFGLIGVIGAMVALAYFALRLSPAAALAVRDKDIRTVEGWRATRGRFGGMFGAAILIVIIVYVAMLILAFVFGAILLSDAGLLAAFEGLGNADEDTAEAALLNFRRRSTARGFSFLL